MTSLASWLIFVSNIGWTKISAEISSTLYYLLGVATKPTTLLSPLLKVVSSSLDALLLALPRSRKAFPGKMDWKTRDNLLIT